MELDEPSRVRCIGPDGRAIKNLLNTKVLVIVVKVDLSDMCLTRLILGKLEKQEETVLT